MNIRERAWDLELFDDHLEGAESKFSILAPYCKEAKVHSNHIYSMIRNKDLTVVVLSCSTIRLIHLTTFFKTKESCSVV